MAPIHPLRRAFAAVAGVALVALPLIALDAAPAQAETPGVVASCAQLTVKPNGYAAKGELRIVVDGEVQTDGDESGWTTFKGSFPGVYAFEPDAAHRYTVEINSFSDGSGGRAFTPGTGGDVRITGTTTSCSPVVVQAAGSNCTSASSAAKQSVSLEFSGLRRSVTYLSEVLDADGEVVKHFQFRTAPVVEHRFTGLSAGATYIARVTDQSNPVLSGETLVRIGDCASTPTVSLRFSPCTVDRTVSTLAVDLDDLVPGRDYRVTAAAGAGRSVEARGTSASVAFSHLHRGDRISVSVADEDAPRSVTIAAVVPTCGDANAGQPTGPGASAPSGPGGTQGSPGSTPSQPTGPTGTPSAGSPAAGSPSTGRPTTGSPTGGGPTTGAPQRPGPAGPGAAASGTPSDVAAGAGTTVPASQGAAAEDASTGPGDSGSGVTAGGSAAGGNGLVAATEQERRRAPTAVAPIVLTVVAALGLSVAALIRRRRAG